MTLNDPDIVDKNIVVCGVYQISSVVKPERIYIGSSVNIRNRWAYHRVQLGSDKHFNKRMQNHYNKYGEEDLVFSVLVECVRGDVVSLEQCFLNVYNPIFNARKVANSNAGWRWSEETRAKTMEARRNSGYRHSEETKRKISEKAKGRDMRALWTKSVEKRRTPVLQFTKDGVFVREWNSISAAEKSLKIIGIVRVLAKEKHRHTAGGFKWKYKDENYTTKCRNKKTKKAQ